MRKLVAFILLALTLVIFIPAANSTEILAISPGCIQLEGQDCTYYPIISGEKQTFEIRIFNLQYSEKIFLIRSEGDLENSIEFSPNTFVISNNYDRSIAHRSCISEDGCQSVSVTVNTKGVAPGKYETLLIAGTTFDSVGSLALDAEVASRLLIEVQENSFYKITRILKENSLVIFGLILLLMASLLFVFKKKLSEFIQNKKADEIYKKSKMKHKK